MEHLVRSSKQLGHILQRVRKEKNITQGILGETISMRQATISKLEAGEPGTRIETLMVVLAALGLEIVIRPRKTASESSKNSGLFPPSHKFESSKNSGLFPPSHKFESSKNSGLFPPSHKFEPSKDSGLFPPSHKFEPSKDSRQFPPSQKSESSKDSEQFPSSQKSEPSKDSGQ